MRPFHKYLCLLTLCLGLVNSPASIAQELTPDAQKGLLQMAERWGVPQPHPDSRMLKIWAFQLEDADRYALGFVEPGNPDRAIVGFDHWDIRRGVDIKEIPDLSQVTISDVTSTSPFSEVHGVNFGLITGIQLLRSGEEYLGVALINKALGEDAGHLRSPFRSPSGEAPLLMLARSCLAAALNEITSSKPNFPGIKQRIEILVADQPTLKSEALDSVLESLQATVAHKPSPEGSIERVIDDFLLSGKAEGALSVGREEFPPAQRVLILKGFQAIPALIQQRQSRRFTNHLMQGFNNFISFPMNAGQAIDAYLHRFANKEFDSDWLRRQQGGTAKDEAILAWWKEASAIGEEAYVKKNCVVVDEEHNASVSIELLLLAEVRYPALLPELCQSLLRTSTPSSPVFEAIARSDGLPRDRKLEILEQGIATNNQSHRNAALGYLQDIDPSLADEYLLRLLEEAPSTAKGEYWTDQDANLGRYVSNSRDPEVWRAFHALLERADLGMRMELISNTHPLHDAPETVLRSFHAIYARFCDDRTVRDESTSEKYSGPCAGFPYARIAMQDFIHRHWAQWLDLELKSPEEDAAPSEWKIYRDTVGIAIRQHQAEQRDRFEPE